MAVLPSRYLVSGEPIGDKLFLLTGTSSQGQYQVWGYPFTYTPLTCTVLKQATISVSPKTATNELGPGQTHTVTATVNAGSGADFSDLWVGCSFDVTHRYSWQMVQGFVGADGLFGWKYDAIQGPAGLYTDTIRACFNNSEKMTCDEATKTWVDTTPPKITITSPVDGAKYLLNEAVTANYSVQDAVGVVLITITPNVSVGGPIPTGQPGTKTFVVTAKDYGNNTAIKSVTYQVLAPLQATQGLSSDVINSPLPQDIKNGLNDKLTAAINALNLGNKKAAINILGAFIDMINAQRGKSLTNAQADSWIAEAQKIIDSIKKS